MAKKKKTKINLPEILETNGKTIVPVGVQDKLSQLTDSGTSPFDNIEPTKNRVLSVTFDMLEKMSEKNPIVSAIINKRCEQMRPFCTIAVDDKDRGFKITTKRNAPEDVKKDTETMALLEDFFFQTGFMYDDEREDDFADFVQLLVRDVLTFDQNAVELRRNKKGEMFDFWYVDGSSIKRVHEERGAKEYGKKIKFVQVDKNDHVIAKYTHDDLIFDYSNKRGRLKYRGYGYAKAEQAIDIITTILFSFAYNKDLFVKNKIPKGFIKVMGDVDDKTIRKVRNAWVNEMQGYGGQFKVPIVPSGKDGVGLDWQSLGQNNREMEYSKMINMMISIICAVYSIDPAEIGIKADQSTSIIGDSGDARIQHSKDSGLGSIVAYTETICNKILSKISPHHVFKFTGIKNDDRKAESDIHKAEIESYKTINEVREAQGLEKIEEDYANVVLNPQAVQIYNQQAMAGGEGEEGEEGEMQDDAMTEMTYEDENLFGEENGDEKPMEKSEKEVLEIFI